MSKASSDKANDCRIIPPSVIKEFILNVKQPAVIGNGVHSWKLSEWSLKDWGNAMKSMDLPFRVGQKYCIVSPQWERTCKIEKFNFNEFIRRTENQVKECQEFSTDDISSITSVEETKKEVWMYFDYKYMDRWFESKSEVLESVSWESFGFPELTGKDSTIWLGSEGAHTPCHFDSYGVNIVAQIFGRKLWVLFPPNTLDEMRPTRVPYEESSIYSSINFYCGFSDFGSLKEVYIVTLEPGDVLIVPNGWWHYVENLSTAISINTWIPLESDDERRLEECLVKNVVMSAIKNMTFDKKQAVLNPNELSLLEEAEKEEHGDGITYCVPDTTQLKWCIEKCIEREENREMLVKNENKEKHIDNSIKEILAAYESINLVNKTTIDEMIIILREKCKCSTKKSKVKTTLTGYGSVNISNYNGGDIAVLCDYINALCHPDVINNVKKRLLLLNKKNDCVR